MATTIAISVPANAAAPPSSNNIQRWFTHGIETNAWPLVIVASTSAAVGILGCWVALTDTAASSSTHAPRTSDLEAHSVFDVRFAPLPTTYRQQLYLAFSTTVFAKLGLVIPLVVCYVVGWQLPDVRLARVVDALVTLLCASTLALDVLLVLSIRSAANTQQLPLADTHNASVTALWNAVYCHARITALCADPTVSLATLQRVFNSNDSLVHVLQGCRAVLTQLELMSTAASAPTLLLSPIDRTAFLATTASSDATDHWCSAFILTHDSSSLTNTQALAAPAVVYSARFREFAVAWSMRLDFDGVMLSIVSVSLLLICVAWSQTHASDKRPVHSCDTVARVVASRNTSSKGTGSVAKCE